MEKILKTIKAITPFNEEKANLAMNKINMLTKPLGSLGRMEEIAKRIVGITGNLNPTFNRKVIFTMAADHGVTEEGVSAYPKEVTPQMVLNFLRGGAAINVFAKHVGAEVIVVDMGVAEKVKTEGLRTGNFIEKKIAHGTKNFTKGPAMTKEEAIKSVTTGIEIFESVYKHKKIDIVGTGDMGIGNTTSSSAIVSVTTGENPAKVTGRGTGISDEGLKNKIAAIKKGIEINKPDRNDAIDILTKLGGYEIGGLVGIMLAAASKNVPVVVDGFISGAASLLAYKLAPQLKDYMFAGHCSVEIGHKVTLNYIGLQPIMDMNMRLGEGTGAALAINVIEAAIKMMNEMATFDEANVSKAN